MIATDSLAGELAVYLKAEADSILKLEQMPYKMDKYDALL